jgi:phosphate transport system substrate-binding protein
MLPRAMRWLPVLFVLVACGAPPAITPAPAAQSDGSSNATVAISGSSTVYPLTLRVAHGWQATGVAAEVTIENVGTGGGFRAFCADQQIDIVNASRAITASEQQNCAANGRTPVELPIAIDALAIAVSRENTFLTDLTIEQLAQIFSGVASTWRDVDPTYPAEPIALFSPGIDSGTADFFIERVLANDRARLAKGATTSEDDDVLVRGLVGNKHAIGYFGYAYYRFNAEQLRTVPIKRTATAPAITPSAATAADTSYPFVRSLFLYTDERTVREQPIVGQFLSHYLQNVNRYIDDVGYFPQPRERLAQSQAVLVRLRG